MQKYNILPPIFSSIIVFIVLVSSWPMFANTIINDNFPDHIWMDHYKLREGHKWMRVMRNGHVLYLHPAGGKVDHVKQGRIEPARAEKLFAMIKEINFFDMVSVEPSDDHVIEDDILTIGAVIGNRGHNLTLRPPTRTDANIMDLVDQMYSISSMLDPVDSDRKVIKVVRIENERAKKLQQDEIVRICDEEIMQYKGLMMTLGMPGQYFLPEDGVLNELSKKFQIMPYFMVSSGNGIFAIDPFVIESGK